MVVASYEIGICPVLHFYRLMMMIQIEQFYLSKIWLP